MVAVLAPFVVRFGLRALLRNLFAMRVAVAATGLLGFSSPWFAGLFLLLNKVVTETVCRHTTLVVADLVPLIFFFFKLLFT
jgi:hypothetical protein